MPNARAILKRALLENRKLYTLGTLSLLLTSLTEVATPKFSQWCIDLLTAGDAPAAIPTVLVGATPTASLQRLVIGFSGLLVMAVIGRWGWRQTMARRTHEAGFELKLKLWESLRFQPLALFERHTLGDIMSRATADWNASRNIFGFTLVLSWDLIFFTTLSIALMFSIDPLLAAATLTVWPFLPRFIIRLARLERRQHMRAQEKLAMLSDLISQSLSSCRLQKATAMQEIWAKRLNRDAKAYADDRIEVLKTSWRILPLSAIPTLFAYGVLFSIGILRVRDANLSIGEFVALCSYVLLLQGPLFELGNHISEWQRGLASLDRLSEIFDLKTPYRKGEAPVRARPNAPILEVKELTFGFPSDSMLLQSLSLSLVSGESLGIIGPIGSGKSTLVKLLSGLLEPPRNSVFIAGQDVTEMNHADWISKVSVVPQRAFMFAGTLRHNLSLGDELTDERLWAALEVVELYREVKAWPDGLETRVGEWGVNLSGGQRQRLALARALLRPKEVLLLDDCLSAVDAHTEEHILTKVETELRTRACLWVAHRASTLRLCKTVFELADGVLVQVVSAKSGTREDAVVPMPSPSHALERI